MPTYRFTQDDHLGVVTIVDPIIDIMPDIINPNVSKIDFETYQYSVEIKMTTNDAQYQTILKGVQAESLSWENEGANMMSQILTRLENNEI